MSNDPQTPAFHPTVSIPPDGPPTITSGAGSPHGPMPERHFGDYELLDEIARGAMGVVYRAHQISLNRDVAVKMILAGRFASETDVQRFRQEAEAAANLDHPNILPIYEVGDHEGHQFFSMKLADGGTLSERMSDLRQDTKLAVRILEQVARGVHHAHQRGILHRDLKPANILLAGAKGQESGIRNQESGISEPTFLTPLVTDFGLAKRTVGDSTLTQSGAIVGTPSYMSPEQARGSKVLTTAADVYSLGAILYEVLAGQPPFRGESIAQTLRMVEENEPALPRSVNGTADADLQAIALKCLEKDPARRYETAGAFADDLAAWLRGEPVTARRAGWTRRARKWVRRNPAVAGLSVAVILALIAGSVVSAVYAVRAEKRAIQAAASEKDAREQEATVRDREEILQDTLCVATFERARAERLAGRPGWRGRSLQLVEAAAKMRVRSRNANDTRVALPDVADLRSEAIMALSADDAAEVRSISLSFMSMISVSTNNSHVLQMSFLPGATPEATVRIVDVRTGKDVHRTTVPIRADEVNERMPLTQIVALDNDGKRALCRPPTFAGPVGLREVPSGKLITELTDAKRKEGITASTDRARLSPNGKKVAVVWRFHAAKKEEVELVVWDFARPDTPDVLDRREAKPQSMFMFGLDVDTGEFAMTRFSNDSKRLCYTSLDRKTIHMRDVSVSPPAKLPDIPVPGQLVSLEWHPTKAQLAMIVTGAEGPSPTRLLLWDIEKAKVIASREWEFASIYDQRLANIAFSLDGRWLAIGGGQSAIVYVLGATDLAERFHLLDGALIGVYRIFWTPDGELAVGGVMESMRLYRPVHSTFRETIANFRAIGKPAFSSDDKRLAIFAPTNPIPKSSFFAEILGDRGTGTLDRVALIDRRKGDVEHYLPGSKKDQGRYYFSPDGARLAVEETDVITVYDTNTAAKLMRKTPPIDAGITSWSNTFYLPDGRLATVATLFSRPSKEKKPPDPLVLWDIASETIIHRFDGIDSRPYVSRNEISPDGSRMLLSRGMDANILQKDKSLNTGYYELPSGKLIAEIPRRKDEDQQMLDVAGITWKGDRALSIHMDILSAEASLTNALWKVQALPSGEELLSVQNRGFVEHGSAFSVDGRFLALAVDKGQVEVWDINSRSLLFRYQPHGSKAVEHITFAPNGDMATTAQNDERLMVLKLQALRERLSEMGLGW